MRIRCVYKIEKLFVLWNFIFYKITEEELSKNKQSCQKLSYIKNRWMLKYSVLRHLSDFHII